MIKIGDRVVAHIFHMSATGTVVSIESSAEYGTEYLVRVGNRDYWVTVVTPA